MVMTERRDFIKLLTASGASLFLPEWLLDPPKGHSMVTVPQLSNAHTYHTYFVDPGKLEDGEFWMELQSSTDGLSWKTAFPSLDHALDKIPDISDGNHKTIYCRGVNEITGHRVIRNTNLVVCEGEDPIETVTSVQLNYFRRL
jgi:hypothetical protein